MGFGGDMGLGVVLDATDLFTGPMGAGAAAFAGFDKSTKSASAHFKDMAQSVGAVGVAMTALGSLGLAALSSTLAKSRDFSAGIAEITTLTDEASLSTRALSTMVLDMNAAYGGSTAKQTKALYDGISAGAANAAEAQALLTASNRLAISGRAEVGVALDGLTSSVNAYGDSFANAKNYSDAMFVAVQKGKTTIPELSAVIGRVAPTAAAMGVSFDQVAASIAAVTLKGIKTEEAVTGMKATLAGIIQPTSDAAAEAARLGVKFTAAELRAKGFDGFLKQITGSAKFNKDSLAKLFSSVEALNTVLALTANGSSAFNSTLDAMKSKSGATDKAFEKMSATLAFQQKRFDGLKENALTLIGSALEPGAAAAVRFGNSLLTAFNALPDPVRNFLVKAAALASTLLVIVGSALAAGSAIALTVAKVAELGVTFSGVLSVAAPLALAVGTVALAFAGLKVAYDKNLGGFGDSVRATFDQAALAYNAFAQYFEDGGFSGAVRDDLNKADNAGLKNFVVRMIVFGGRIQTFFEGISTGFSAAITAAQPAIDAFMGSLRALTNDFGGLYETLDPSESTTSFTDWGNAGKKTGAFLGELAGKAIELATAGIELARDIKPVVGVVLDLIDALGGAKTIVKALEIALVVMTVNAVAQASARLGGLAASGVEAGLGLMKTVASMAAMNGVSIGGGLAGAASAIKAFAASAVASVGPVAALTAAITALYLAQDQYNKLDKELGESGWSEIYNKLQNDLFITSDDEYMATQGINQPVVRTDGMVKPTGSVVDYKTPGGVPQGQLFASVAALDAGPAPGADNAMLYATIEALKKAPPAPGVSVKVTLDGQDLISKVDVLERENDTRSGAPTLPVID